MGIDAFIEPLVVATILSSGVVLNRRRSLKDFRDGSRSPSGSFSSGSVTSSTGLLSPTLVAEPQWRERKFFGRTVQSRNTSRWRETRISRTLTKYPFLLEVWYWLLVYWTYQIGRAITALTLQADLMPIARLHGLSIIALEKKLRIFIELDLQGWFLVRPVPLKIINCIYSFIHIPATITFLAWLYHYAPPSLFEARRRTLAICNLMAFVVFTCWPCMPPRLLPEEDGFGFVDTVHAGKVASVWTTNRFCQQLAAMPSLHFGYSFIIGLTIATMPNTSYLRTSNIHRRILLVTVGMAYPTIILIAIFATANHYVLDAVAGFFVALLGWRFNGLLINLLPLEDAFMNFVHVHKPEREENLNRTMSPTDLQYGVNVTEWQRQV